MRTVIPIHARARAAQDKCSRCKNSTCCTYITQHIDSPRGMADFDLMLWQIAHHNVQFFKDSDGWFLQVTNRCTHLLPDGRCGIYEARPLICREHSSDGCEFDGMTEKDFDLFFGDYDALLKYCRRRFKSWEKHSQNQKT